MDELVPISAVSLRREEIDARTLSLSEKRELRRMERVGLGEKVTIHDIAYALRKHLGSIAPAAKSLGLSARYLRWKIKDTPSLQRLQEDILQDNLDTIEYQVMSQAVEGVLPAAIMVLKTLGKARGWSEKATLEHEMGENMQKNAAALIEAMKRGGVVAGAIEEEEDYTWDVPESTRSEVTS